MIKKLPPIPKSLLSTQVFLYENIGTDLEGKIIFNEPKQYKARLQAYNDKTFSNNGEQEIFKFIVYINGDARINAEGKVYWVGYDLLVGKVDKHLNPDGTCHHTKIYLK